MEMYDKAYMNCYMFENDKLDLCEKKNIFIFFWEFVCLQNRFYHSKYNIIKRIIMFTSNFISHHFVKLYFSF